MRAPAALLSTATRVLLGPAGLSSCPTITALRCPAAAAAPGHSKPPSSAAAGAARWLAAAASRNGGADWGSSWGALGPGLGSGLSQLEAPIGTASGSYSHSHNHSRLSQGAGGYGAGVGMELVQSTELETSADHPELSDWEDGVQLSLEVERAALVRGKALFDGCFSLGEMRERLRIKLQLLEDLEADGFQLQDAPVRDDYALLWNPHPLKPPEQRRAPDTWDDVPDDDKY